MIEGVTTSGFHYSIDEDALTDWRFVKAWAKAQKEGTTAVDGLSEAIEYLFNDHEQEERLYKHLADLHGGRIPTENLFTAVGEIIAALHKSKN